ncbi:MAG: DUF4835 family protein [Bacteroidota bacterium]
MKNFILILLVGLHFSSSAQELNCQVTVITNSKLEVTSVEKEVFDQLKQTVYDMMNTTQWTKDKFKVEERINCNIQFQINEIPASGTYKGSIQVQYSRPGFNTSYNTTVFNFQDDDLVFNYSRNAVLIYAPNQYRDNLTSILAFYAYFIIGMDYDTFSLKGGTPYFNEAQSIVSLAQGSSSPGWKSNETGKRNRFYLVDNILHQLFEPLRDCTYEYHRLGIDVLYENKIEGRKAIYAALNKLNKVVAARPNAINLINFVQSKLEELKSLYADAEVKEKNDVVNLLKRIDPANASRYAEILD